MPQATGVALHGVRGSTHMIDPVMFAWLSLNKTPFPTVLGVPASRRGHRTYDNSGTYDNADTYLESSGL